MRIVPDLSIHLFFFSLLSSSDFYPRTSRTLTDLKLRPEQDKGLKIRSHTTESPVHSGSALKKVFSPTSLSCLSFIPSLRLPTRPFLSRVDELRALQRAAIDQHAAQHVIQELARQQHITRTRHESEVIVGCMKLIFYFL